MYRKLDNCLTALCASSLALMAIVALAGDPAALPPGPATASLDQAEPGAEPSFRESGRASGRRGLAMPYFSFARGLRRIGG